MEADHVWRRQIERRLNDLGSRAKGNQEFQADRVADLVEQIEELRQELKRIADKQDKMAEWLKQHIAKKNGS